MDMLEAINIIVIVAVNIINLQKCILGIDVADFNKSNIFCDHPPTVCLHRKNIVFGTYLLQGADWSSTIFKQSNCIV